MECSTQKKPNDTQNTENRNVIDKLEEAIPTKRPLHKSSRVIFTYELMKMKNDSFMYWKFLGHLITIDIFYKFQFQFNYDEFDVWRNAC